MVLVLFCFYQIIFRFVFIVAYISKLCKFSLYIRGIKNIFYIIINFFNNNLGKRALITYFCFVLIDLINDYQNIILVLIINVCLGICMMAFMRIISMRWFFIQTVSMWWFLCILLVCDGFLCILLICDSFLCIMLILKLFLV